MYVGGMGRYPYASQVRRSLPNMAHTMLINEPAKIYPYHLLIISNYRLPADVDRCNLEVSACILLEYCSLIKTDDKR